MNSATREICLRCSGCLMVALSILLCNDALIDICFATIPTVRTDRPLKEWFCFAPKCGPASGVKTEIIRQVIRTVVWRDWQSVTCQESPVVQATFRQGCARVMRCMTARLSQYRPNRFGLCRRLPKLQSLFKLWGMSSCAVEVHQ